MKSDAPVFPPPALVQKALALGVGTGPWSRAQLAKRWGDSAANKFIAEAKEAGWIVSPFTNAFFVPPARDLMVINWLAGISRDEFILSRTLVAAGVKSWCLSAWARSVGIESAEPIFLTDLAPLPEETAGPLSTTPPPAREIAARNRAFAERIRTIPFLDNVILVPYLPQSRRIAEAGTTLLRLAAPTQGLTADWMLEPEPKRVAAGSARSAPDVARLSYPLTYALDEVAWLLACVGALGLPRFNEALPSIRRTEAAREPRVPRAGVPFVDRLRNWSGLFSPPEPNANWRTVFQSGRPQYLLVPPAVWQEFASLSNARRFHEAGKLEA